jgi:menaquinone-dependent protoporphyrinogen IX oxidase
MHLPFLVNSPFELHFLSSHVFVRGKSIFINPIENHHSGDTLKALIAFGTRYGATTGTSEEIAKILREEGFDTKTVNLKEEKIKDISEYDLIIVGSGMGNCRWASEAEDFLKNFRKEFEGKKLALFVSTMKTFFEREGKIDDVARTRKIALEDKVAKYSLKPVALGFFGGVIDYSKMGFIARKGMEFFKPRLEKSGFKEKEPGVYDLRDWDEIRNWAKELSGKARQ